MRRQWLPVLLLGSGLACWACRFDPLEKCESAAAGDRLQCPTPGETDRAFDLAVPESWDGTSPLPVIYAFHGGGGNRASANLITCPDGDESSTSCLVAEATAAGYAVVSPDGTGARPLRNLRTWNAGGGVDGWACTSGGACEAGVDDMAYLDKVHGIVESLVAVDANRVFATGLSNGSSLSHRLACERSERFAAIAAVGGANQHAAAGGACATGSAVLHIHGTEDPINPYEPSDEAEFLSGSRSGLREGVDDSMQKWADRNGCDLAPLEETIEDTEDDRTTSLRRSWQNCDQAVELIRIENGGHTWPGGYLYFSEDDIGLLSTDFRANVEILEFFDAHAR